MSTLPVRRTRSHVEQESLIHHGERTIRRVSGYPQDETGEQQPPDEVESLRAQLQEAQAKAAENLDGWQRALAEFQNYRKRIERDRLGEQAIMKGDLIKKVLPVLDDLERALQNRPAEDAWSGGIELIQRKLLAILEAEGVKRIEAEGLPFDPNVHEAISQESMDDAESGQVLEVTQQGYMLGDRVIRPAQVRWRPSTNRCNHQVQPRSLILRLGHELIVEEAFMGKIIGIDLGTTNSVAAVMQGGEPVVIPSSEGERLVPSVVAVNKNHERLVGRVARNQAIVNPENTVFSIKRFMGRRADDAEVQRSTGRVPYRGGRGAERRCPRPTGREGLQRPRSLGHDPVQDQGGRRGLPG